MRRRRYRWGEVLALRHVPWEGLGALAEGLEARGVSWRYVDLFAGEHVPDLRCAQAVFVMGGPMGVYDTQNYSFLREEVAAIRAGVEAGTPTLGVCLGSQLLASALGAEVKPNPRGKEIGWGPVLRTAVGQADPIFQEFGVEETVLHWHGDVFGLPSGAVSLASSPLTYHQAFRWGPSAWGLLFHVEVDPALARRWLDEPTMSTEASEVDRSLPGRIEKEAPQYERRLRRLRGVILDALLT